ncbi:hypothetical protein PTI98_005569 [Pleurotus ostreatus]|nr:hypothetical protein PTI98_005569 [Pleurotus ostreatus]
MNQRPMPQMCCRAPSPSPPTFTPIDSGFDIPMAAGDPSQLRGCKEVTTQALLPDDILQCSIEVVWSGHCVGALRRCGMVQVSECKSYVVVVSVYSISAESMKSWKARPRVHWAGSQCTANARYHD